MLRHFLASLEGEWDIVAYCRASDAGVNVTSLMSHMGWSDPKTAIRYVQKSKQSAHQMALYLCNAQRANLKQEVNNPYMCARFGSA